MEGIPEGVTCEPGLEREAKKKSFRQIEQGCLVCMSVPPPRLELWLVHVCITSIVYYACMCFCVCACMCVSV